MERASNMSIKEDRKRIFTVPKISAIIILQRCAKQYSRHPIIGHGAMHDHI
jgi:hypothetical protein